MAYKLRFVQRFKAADEKAFLRLEKRFSALEKADPALPRGRRYLSHSGREPSNTLIWECDFPSLRAAESALERLARNPRHESLLRMQKRYFEAAFTEIYRSMK